MSVTAAQVIAQVVWPGPVSSDADRLKAINAAILFSWPAIKNAKVDSSQTLSSGTYEYSPGATDVTLELGFASAYLTHDSSHKILLRRVGQRRNGTAWVVMVPDDIASAYSGETMHLLYNARIPTIDDTSDSIELPFEYLQAGVTYFALLAAIADGNQVSTRPYEALAVQYEKLFTRALLTARGGDLPHTITKVPEFGWHPSADYSRYGGQPLA